MMAALAHNLKIKYGLRNDPSESLVRAWAEATRASIARGVDREEAGRDAAKALFIDYRTHHYASEADTIEMLLRQAGGK
jgi:hypothetical protein